MSAPPEVTVEDFLHTSMMMGRFMRASSLLPSFTDDFTFLHCLVVFAVSKEPRGMPHKVLCRQIGLSWDHAKQVIRQLQTAGAVTVTSNGIQVTDAGLAKLAEVNRQLLPYVQTAIDNPYRLRNLVKLLRYIMRAWGKVGSATRDGSETVPADDSEIEERLEPEHPLPTDRQPPRASVEATPAPRTKSTLPLADRFRSLGHRLLRSSKEPHHKS